MSDNDFNVHDRQQALENDDSNSTNFGMHRHTKWSRKKEVNQGIDRTEIRAQLPKFNRRQMTTGPTEG